MMAQKLSLVLAQLNPTLGDIAGNMAKLRDARRKAAAQGADLFMVPELYVCGYPPEDLVLKQSFLTAIRTAIEALAKETTEGPAILLGAPWREDGKIYNAALLMEGGKIANKILKRDLPNYGPFDEKRVFSAGPLPEPIIFKGHKLGVLVCEDMWTPDAAAHLKKQGAQVLLVLNGSPYESDKLGERQFLARARVKETGLPLVYLNQIGGQDELVFDGTSFVLDAQGKTIAQAEAWTEDLLFTQWNATLQGLTPQPGPIKSAPEGAGDIYHALLLGLRDYVNKNGFPSVVLGLSGGIDSALVAVLAADALGADKVWNVMMPSPYTSKESLNDATALAQALGCRLDTIPITEAMETFSRILAKPFASRPPDTTEENIQSRSRGLILMALSNKFGPMVLSTGNKSEMSVGYSTLYGDMCGGFSVLKDLYKTQVYAVAHWRNEYKPGMALGPSGKIIPENVFIRPPTAELRPDQKDEDNLPPYKILDGILECLIEKDMGANEIIAKDFDAATVKRVWKMLDGAEYKRRQAPPGVKITRRSLGKDRRYPITNKYRETT
jgi:NAD+ synthase